MLKQDATSTETSQISQNISNSAAVFLPVKPLVKIQPRSAWVSLDFGELWGYRELLFFLMWRDIKVRYKQTAFGVIWVVMQPLLTTIIYTIFFGRIAQVPSGGVPYSVFAFAGLLLWSFFSTAVSITSNSLVANANLITKTYFPRIIIPAAAVGARLLDLIITLSLLVCMMLYYHIPITLTACLIPLFILLITIFALGFGMLASALNVMYRDIGTVLPLLIQVWMFASPVLYTSDLIPTRWLTLYRLNPMVGIVEGFRAALFGTKFSGMTLTLSIITTFSLFFCALYLFRKMEQSFADVI